VVVQVGATEMVSGPVPCLDINHDSAESHQASGSSFVPWPTFAEAAKADDVRELRRALPDALVDLVADRATHCLRATR